MSTKRNRSSGWQWAKLSGHKNEAKIEKLLNENKEDFSNLCHDLLGEKDLTGYVTIGGLNEKNVDSILNDTTKSKTDMKVFIDSYKKPINISIKKNDGQVYLIGTTRFIKGFEEHFKQIPQNIKKVLKLYFGKHEEIEKYINNYGDKNNQRIREYEKRKQRLVGDSLKRYNKELAEELLQWFKNNISEITKFCFSRGLAKNKEDWADFIWYKNVVKDKYSINKIFKINNLAEIMVEHNNKIQYGGSTWGGSTIHLPFGFVQWHQGKMQFHHQIKKISEIFN